MKLAGEAGGLTNMSEFGLTLKARDRHSRALHQRDKVGSRILKGSGEQRSARAHVRSWAARAQILVLRLPATCPPKGYLWAL